MFDFHVSVLHLNYFIVICLLDFQKWLSAQAQEIGGFWRILLSSDDVITMAFEHSCVHLHRSTVMGKKVVDITHFRSLLVQLYVISVLWALFRKADSMLDASNTDAFNNTLCFEEFSFAMKSFCACYSHEDLSDQDIKSDFELLDEDNVGSVTFASVCKLCSKFLDPIFAQRFSVATTKERRMFLLQEKVQALSNTREKISLSIKEAPIELIVELQSQPSDEEREYLPAIALSFDDNPNDLQCQQQRLEKNISMNLIAISSPSYPSHGKQRHKRMGHAMECLSAKIEEDLEVAELMSMRLSTWNSLLKSPSSNKIFQSSLSPKSVSTRGCV